MLISDKKLKIVIEIQQSPENPTKLKELKINVPSFLWIWCELNYFRGYTAVICPNFV